MYTKVLGKVSKKSSAQVRKAVVSIVVKSTSKKPIKVTDIQFQEGGTTTGYVENIAEVQRSKKLRPRISYIGYNGNETIEVIELIGNNKEFYYTQPYEQSPYFNIFTSDGSAVQIEPKLFGGKYIGGKLHGANSNTVTYITCYCTLLNEVEKEG